MSDTAERAPFERVLSPIAVGPITLGNRIVRTAHATGTLAGPGGEDAFVAYHDARARGGVGLTILEVASVHPSSPAYLQAWDDRIIPRYRQLIEAVAPRGMAVFQQLWHGGHQTAQPGWGPPWAVSAVAGPKLGVTAPPMSVTQIDELVAAFAAAASRAVEGGLQGVEVHAGHGYLLNQFLSPQTNQRTDAYGGSERNRERMLVEVLQAVRDRVGGAIAVGVRLSADELIPGGLRPEDVAGLAQRLESAGLVDFVDLSVGGYLAYPPVIGGSHEPPGYQLDHVRPVSAALDVPTIVAGRITTLRQAEEVLASGVASLISMVRATIADPDLVIKEMGGRGATVRPCIACNQGCVAGIATGRIGCTVNPAAGAEQRLADDRLGDRSVRPRRVLVAGGGPAGMEAARVAALSGHAVTLAERGPALGGQLQLARRAPHRETFGHFADWLGREVIRLGVEVLLDTTVDADLVDRLDADVVVLASGSEARTDGRQIARPGHVPPGVSLPHVLTGRQVMAGDVPDVHRAVLVDDGGDYEAIGVAEVLAHHGVEIDWVTRHPHPGSALDDALVSQPARGRLRHLGVRVHPEHLLTEIRSDVCTITDIAAGNDAVLPTDLVILVCGGVPVQPDLSAVADHIDVHTVGDAAGVRSLHAAVREANKVAREL